MNKTLRWLQKIEKLAEMIYLKASDYFKEDEVFSRFLKELAEDETVHFKLIETFVNRLDKDKMAKLSLTLDAEVHYKIEFGFAEINRMIDEKTLSKRVMWDKIIELEFSEWNDFFVYVVSLIQGHELQFSKEIKAFKDHLTRIETFCDHDADLKEKIITLKQQRPIWNENILIVEDEEIISELLQNVLRDEGDVEIASNGEEGIQKVKNKYYKLIISDIDMPVMDGLTFFQTASRMFPNISERFLFFTGNLSDDKRNFLNKNRLPYMLKPASLTEIKKIAVHILDKN